MGGRWSGIQAIRRMVGMLIMMTEWMVRIMMGISFWLCLYFCSLFSAERVNGGLTCNFGGSTL